MGGLPGQWELGTTAARPGEKERKEGERVVFIRGLCFGAKDVSPPAKRVWPPATSYIHKQRFGAASQRSRGPEKFFKNCQSKFPDALLSHNNQKTPPSIFRIWKRGCDWLVELYLGKRANHITAFGISISTQGAVLLCPARIGHGRKRGTSIPANKNDC